MDVVKTRYLSDDGGKYRGVADCAISTLKIDGVRGFFKVCSTHNRCPLLAQLTIVSSVVGMVTRLYAIRTAYGHILHAHRRNSNILGPEHYLTKNLPYLSLIVEYKGLQSEGGTV